METVVHNSPDPKPAHEPNTLSAKGVVGLAIALAALVAVAMCISHPVWIFFDRTDGEKIVSLNAMQSTARSNGPRLQPSVRDDAMPYQDLAKMRQREMDEFDRRGWVDHGTGAIMIPPAIAQQVIAESAKAPSNRRSP